ncbi:hypothetical protein BTO18_07200 [Polaribacter porphyrae]|uniref:Outer membrane lipoprotein-sorting protein n=2 Tax=Polaribacter porphyrae TaxID=1137780 RepID=A0A2S7WMZ5_9FLAO|nr:hypothetical protein BTO18_07200 [Polaribacter porphyrae]
MFLCSITILKAQTAEEIIEKHIEKIGGKKAWSNIQSIQLRGEFISSQGSEEILSISKKGKHKGHKKINGKMVVQYTFDGVNFWDLDRKSGKLIKSRKDVSFRAKKEANEFPSMLVVAKKLGYTVELVGEEDIMGISCYKLKIKKGKTYIIGKEVDDIAILFLNKDTYLEVLKEEKHVRGGNMIYTYYKDFQKVEGVLMPFTINWFNEDRQSSINVKAYIVNAKIDDAIFKANK